MTAKTTIDVKEVEKFAAQAKQWWDEEGNFKPLHKLNLFRVPHIKSHVCKHFAIQEDNKLPFKGLDILDVGCGGGILTEPLARLGGNVTGLDAAEKNIEIAKLHAKQSNLKINYMAQTIEDHVAKGKKYDVITALEVVEHVANPEIFVENCCKALKPGGVLFMSTISRTAKSYAMAIVGAEYILRLLPVGTHEWKKFIKPSELSEMLEKNNLKIADLTGVSFNPINYKYKAVKDLSVNYMLVANNNIEQTG